MIIKEKTETLFRFERTYPVFDAVHQGVRIWPLLRLKFLQALGRGQSGGIPLQDSNLITDPQKDSVTFEKRKKQWEQQVKEWGEVGSERLGSGDHLYFIQASKVVVDEQNKGFHRLFDSLIDLTGTRRSARFLYWNDNRSSILPEDLHSPVIPYGPLIGKLQTLCRNSAETELDETVVHLVRAWNRENPEASVEIETILEECTVLVRLISSFQSLLKNRPRAVFLTCFYCLPAYALAQACRTLGIPCIEMQHGQQGDHHSMYTHRMDAEKGYPDLLPSHFWAWGKSSQERMQKWWSPEVTEVRLGGNPWIAYRASKSHLAQNRRSSEARERKVCLISMQEATLGQFVVDTIKNRPDIEWWFRLHPKDYRQAEQFRTQCEGNFGEEIRWDLDRASTSDLFDLFEEVDVHLTGWSTTAHEAHHFGVPTILIHPNGKSAMGEAINAGVLGYAENPEELSRMIDAPPFSREHEPFIRADPREINEVFDSLVNPVQSPDLVMKQEERSRQNRSVPPVLVTMFNRPEHATRVIEAIAKVKPRQIFLAVDGPREDVETDRERVEQCRALRSLIDWDCEVKTHFRENNLGCREGMIDNLTWFFSEVEKGVILEDDCVPDEEFFDFASELFPRMGEGSRLMQVSGYAHVEHPSHESSFLPIMSSWGWGTSREVWQGFLSARPSLEEDFLSNPHLHCAFDLDGAYPFSEMFQRNIEGKVNSWAILFYWYIFRQSGLVAYPARSLIENIGFDGSGTHYSKPNRKTVPKRTEGIGGIIPEQVALNEDMLRQVRQSFLQSRHRRKQNSGKREIPRKRTQQNKGRKPKPPLRKNWFDGILKRLVRRGLRLLEDESPKKRSPRKKQTSHQRKATPEMLRKKNIAKYHDGGRVPRSTGYSEFKWDFISSVIADEELCRQIQRGEVPDGYGIGLDERVVAYPWVMAHLREAQGSVLDVGLALNFAEIMRAKALDLSRLTIVGLAVERQCHYDLGVSYQFADLRELPYRDQWFDLVVCISTLEHIGMDNAVYGHGNEESGIDSSGKDYLKAVGELIRVAQPSGSIAISVPVGIYENHGFFQQFDRAMLDRMIDSLQNFGKVNESFFRYTEQGWTGATWEECQDAKSYNPQTGKGKGEDGAAHCRAVACLFVQGQ